MNMNDLVGIYESAQTGEVTMDQVRELRDCLTDTSGKAREVILQRTSEADFVKVRSLMKRTILAIMMSKGGTGSTMLQAVDLTDSSILNGLLDTFVLVMIGLMIQDEIL